VVMEAYTGGISTRKVDSLVEALGGASGISKSEVSRICAGLDEQVKAFLSRPLDHASFPYVYLDATYLHGRLGRNLQVCSRAVAGLIQSVSQTLLPGLRALPPLSVPKRFCCNRSRPDQLPQGDP
jgi:hypothetical protein